LFFAGLLFLYSYSSSCWWLLGSKCRNWGDSSQYLYGLKTLAALGAHSPGLTLAALGAHSPGLTLAALGAHSPGLTLAALGAHSPGGSAVLPLLMAHSPGFSWQCALHQRPSSY
jgi:hypothetical protein